MDISVWLLNLCSGLVGAIAGGAITVWSTKKALQEQRLLEDQRALIAERREIQKRAEEENTRNRSAGRWLLVSVKAIVAAIRQNNEAVAYANLKTLRDLMINNEWLCSPETNARFFDQYLLDLSETPSFNSWKNAEIAQAAQTLVVPDA